MRTPTRTVLTSTAKHFHLYPTFDTYEGDRRIYSRNRNIKIPQNFLQLIQRHLINHFFSHTKFH